MNPLQGYAIPQDIAAAAQAAQDEASAATRAIKDLNARKEQVIAARDTVAAVQSAADAGAQAVVKRAALDAENRKKYPNTKLTGKLGAEIAELDKLAADFSTKQAAVTSLTQQIDQGIPGQIAQLEADRAAATAKAQSILPLKQFERDRTSDKIRDIEGDLLRMRQALDTFRNSPLQPSQPCLAGYEQFLDTLQQDVDDRAHKGKCHLCSQTNPIPQINQIPRTQEAKAKVAAKIKELEQLAPRPNDAGLSEEQKANYMFAKSLEKIRNTLDDKGKTGGKMIGVLICRDPATQQEVVLYGFSGVVNDRQRLAGVEVARCQEAVNQAPQDAGALLALTQAQQELAQAVAADLADTTRLEQYWADSIPLAGSTLRSVGGRTQTIEQLEAIKGGNNPAGVCSAPKMIQEALNQGLELVSMAEAWYGGGDNKHNELVASCDTCMSNIGFQLCPQCT